MDRTAGEALHKRRRVEGRDCPSVEDIGLVDNPVERRKVAHTVLVIVLHKVVDLVVDLAVGSLAADSFVAVDSSPGFRVEVGFEEDMRRVAEDKKGLEGSLAEAGIDLEVLWSSISLIRVKLRLDLNDLRAP